MASSTDLNQDIKVSEKVYYSGRNKPLRVVCIGAGAAGIYAGIAIPRHIAKGLVELQIYEKNPDFGGCWFENRYPGCACDIPSHVYSYSFAPNPNWTHFYSSSSEIQQYFKGVAIKYDVSSYTKFNHKVVGAYWNEEGFWDLKVQAEDNSIFDDRAEILINASGILNAWKWPVIEGLDNFAGPKLHSANWDDNVKFDANSRVGLIGNGSSAIQILPRLQPIVNHLSTFIRTKTWIALPFTNEKVKRKGAARGADETKSLIEPKFANPEYTEEERARFRNDPQELRRYRKEIETENNSRFVLATEKESDGAKAAIPKLTAIMKGRLVKKPELADALIPEWHVGCRRLTPGVGYLEAICEDNVNVVTTPIDHIAPKGIVTKDGKLHEMDVLVCATGFDVSTRPHFDVVGRNGYIFTDEWAKSPKGYLTVTMSNLPNYFMVNGPNAPVANGSLIPAMEKAVDYIVKMIDKVVREDIRSVCIRKSTEDAFCDYVDAWMPRSIWSSGCRSWYKGGTTDGRVSGVWPGSINHYMKILENPRFEDYEYTYLERNNPFSFFGNGYTENDVNPDADKAPYLNNAYIDV